MFGGWLVSQMDLAAWVKARKISPHRLATVAIDNIVFHKPVFVGDCLLCYAGIERIGNTSITIKVEAHVERIRTHLQEQVTEGRFVFVAIDDDYQPIAVRAEPTAE
jgi:acyl-CoA thioesterase YciA